MYEVMNPEEEGKEDISQELYDLAAAILISLQSEEHSITEALLFNMANIRSCQGKDGELDDQTQRGGWWILNLQSRAVVKTQSLQEIAMSQHDTTFKKMYDQFKFLK